MKLSEAVRGVSGTLAADGEFSCIAFATEQEQSQFLTFLERKNSSRLWIIPRFPVC